MILVFTHSDKAFSKAIMNITGEPVSHCAVIINEYVIHSNMLGVRVDKVRDFLDHNKIVVSLRMSQEDQKRLLLMILLETQILAKYAKLAKKRTMYDYGGFVFLGLNLILNKIFGVKLSDKNLWQESGAYLCTELLQEIIDKSYINSMVTPYKLCSSLEESGDWVRI
jgi:hypothetical protein